MFKFVKNFFIGDASSYVGHPGDLTFEGSTLSYHDGATSGGFPVSPPISGPLVPLAGGDPNGTPLSYGYNIVNCAVTNYDSVTLPPAIPGTSVVIIVNPDSGDPTVTIGVWPQTNDSVNGLAGDFLYYTPNPLNSGSPPALYGTIPCVCLCVVAGQWISNFELG